MGSFFVAGFLFDVLTLDRIDSTVSLVQQGVYLAVLIGLLLWEQKVVLTGAGPSGWQGKAWRYSEDVIHFLFGSLLSSYALFYFKSSSGFSSVAFMAVLVALLLANELPRFRQLGTPVRFCLLSLCLSSYLAYLVPVLAGFIRWYLFVLALALAGGTLALLWWVLERWTEAPRATAMRTVLPAGGVLGVLLVLYLLKAIPPVPLSVSHIGIYHQVEREGGSFKLSHQRPPWRLWHQGDQTFLARPGDKVHVFARVFAPTRFRDRVNVRWWHHTDEAGWESADTIPLTVTGGRAGGYGGYAYKARYEPGDWKVALETEDGREISHIRFTVEPDEGVEPRTFQVDYR